MTDKPVEEMSDQELYDEYQDAKENGPVLRIDELQREICQRWEETVGDQSTYNVYENRGTPGESFIGSVEADSLEQARSIADEDYDAPVSVEES